MAVAVRISAVIPCHDAAPFVAETLASVAAQTRAPDEVILVDDASRDGSAEVARRALPELRVVTLAADATGGGRGPSAARNAGVAATGGDLVAFLDADDLWRPDHLARGEAQIAAGADVLYATARDTLDPRGRILPARPRSITTPTHGLGARDFTRLWYEVQDVMTSSFLVRKAAFAEVGGFDESLRRAEDLDFCLRLLDGRTFAYDPRPGLVYRRGTPGSLTQDRIATGLDGLRCWTKNLPRYPWQREQVQRNARALLRLILRAEDPGPLLRAHADLMLPLLAPRDRRLATLARHLPRAATLAMTARDDWQKRLRPLERELRGRVRGRQGAPRRDEILHAIVKAACGRDGLRARVVLAADAATAARARTETAQGAIPAWLGALLPDAAASRIAMPAELAAGAGPSRTPEAIALLALGHGAHVLVAGERHDLGDGQVAFVNPGCSFELHGDAGTRFVLLRGPLTRRAAGVLFFGEDVPPGFSPVPPEAAPPPAPSGALRDLAGRIRGDLAWLRHLASGDLAWARPGDDDDQRV